MNETPLIRSLRADLDICKKRAKDKQYPKQVRKDARKQAKDLTVEIAMNLAINKFDCRAIRKDEETFFFPYLHPRQVMKNVKAKLRSHRLKFDIIGTTALINKCDGTLITLTERG